MDYPKRGDWIIVHGCYDGPCKVIRINIDQDEIMIECLNESGHGYEEGKFGGVEERTINKSQIEEIVVDPLEINELEKEYSGGLDSN